MATPLLGLEDLAVGKKLDELRRRHLAGSLPASQLNSSLQMILDGRFHTPIDQGMPQCVALSLEWLVSESANIAWMSHGAIDQNWRMFDERGQAIFAYREHINQAQAPIIQDLDQILDQRNRDLHQRTLVHELIKIVEIAILNSFMVCTTGQPIWLLGIEVKDRRLRRHFEDIANYDLSSEIRLQVGGRFLGPHIEPEYAELLKARWKVWQAGYAVLNDANRIIFVYRRDTPWV